MLWGRAWNSQFFYMNKSLFGNFYVIEIYTHGGKNLETLISLHIAPTHIRYDISQV